MTIRTIGRIRSVLFAPAVRTDHLDKLASRGADVVVIDCEDATPADRKAEARQNARRYSQSLAAQGATVVVRVNAVTTQWFEDDINELGPDVVALMVPMVESGRQMEEIDAVITAADFADLGVFVGLETARGVANSVEILSHGRAIAAYFGAEDYIADVGGRRTAPNTEVLFARSQVAMAARIGGVPAADQVVTDFRNAERFQTEADFACNLGFRGKLCIHPGQVDIANAAFTPTEEAVQRAHEIVAAHQAATAAGVSVADYKGQMIDGPLVAQAQQILRLAGGKS
ncbi:MAG: CoA ester lyase [Acidimicrobiales bacterium]|nr:CoA ester lyase [Acidimicrobiales bacterium]